MFVDIEEASAGNVRPKIFAAAWPQAGEARHRCFDRRSARLVGMAATGIEALLSQRQKNREPHRAASETLVNEIRRELRDVAGIVLA